MGREQYFGLRGGWLTFWVTVAAASDMALFGQVALYLSFFLLRFDLLHRAERYATELQSGLTRKQTAMTRAYLVGSS